MKGVETIEVVKGKMEEAEHREEEMISMFIKTEIIMIREEMKDKISNWDTKPKKYLKRKLTIGSMMLTPPTEHQEMSGQWG